LVSPIIPTGTGYNRLSYYRPDYERGRLVYVGQAYVCLNALKAKPKLYEPPIETCIQDPN